MIVGTISKVEGDKEYWLALWGQWGLDCGIATWEDLPQGTELYIDPPLNALEKIATRLGGTVTYYTLIPNEELTSVE